MKKAALATIGLLLIFLFSVAEAATVYNFQGKLTDKSGKAVTSKTKVIFRLYTTPTGGKPVWTEEKEATPDPQGRLQAKLGETSSLNLTPGVYYVEVQINGENLTPRSLVTHSTSPKAALSITRPLAHETLARDIPSSAGPIREKYARYLEENPIVRQAINWRVSSRIQMYDSWTAEMKNDLFRYIIMYETGRAFPYTAPPTPLPTSRAETTVLAPEDCWNLYLASIAFSLYVEINELVDWRLSRFSEDGIRQLFSSTNVVDGHDGFQYITPGNPKICYDFLKNRSMIKSNQGQTVFAFTDWCRKYLYHWIGPSYPGLHEYYGYWGAPPVDQLLTPRLTIMGDLSLYKSMIWGCGGTSAFYKTVLRSINLPVKLHTRLGGAGGTHYGFEIPSANLAAISGDDMYMTSRFGLYYIPTARLFTSYFDLVRDFPDPHATPDMSTYNWIRKWSILYYTYPSDENFIKDRCYFLDPTIAPAYIHIYENNLASMTNLSETEKADLTRRTDEIINREGGPRSFLARSNEYLITEHSTPP